VLDWTGERYIPGEGGSQLRYEHEHRYAVARGFCAGRAVLDYGSGEGYGAHSLSEVAASVLGVDIDPQAVSHAQELYESQTNLQFRTLEGHRLLEADRSFDVITCFEVIEHVSNPEAVIIELARLLKSDGVLLISTPNKAEYSDLHDYKNPFHVREFYIDEFRPLLTEHFASVHFLGQRIIATSVVYALETPDTVVDQSAIQYSNVAAPSLSIPYPPMYVVALCSHSNAPTPFGSVHAPQDDILSRELLSAVPRKIVDKVLADMEEERKLAREQLDRYEEQLRVLQQQPQEKRWSRWRP